MNTKIRQLSSLDKVFPQNRRMNYEISNARVLKGERFSYQLEIQSDVGRSVSVAVQSELGENITVYREGFAYCDLPTFAAASKAAADADYLTSEPCLIPDILTPLSRQNNKICISRDKCLLWIRVDIPRNVKCGTYPVVVILTADGVTLKEAHLELEVLPYELPENAVKYTQWFYSDCIANVHGVKVYSEEHWKLIEEYIKTAADCGINMILTPVHNPPLDTAVGAARTDVQLAEITKTEEGYAFDFTRLERWLKICGIFGIRYIEIPHLFSQWGAKFAPNIYVCEDGVRTHLFGWHTKSDSKEYTDFLKEYLPALTGKLRELGWLDRTYFHISDEPSMENIEAYERNAKSVHSILDGAKVIDALSDIDFYKKGLVDTPVPANDHIEPFLSEDIKERWVYYCCCQGNGVSNRFLAMSSFRNRIIGIQMYKFGVTGFLQWGYNYYYARLSEYEINPYITTSGDYAFPSGDAFSVYPSADGALPSIRAFVFYEALQDMALCKLLENRTSRDFVVRLIDEIAGQDVRFASIPSDDAYLFVLRERILDELQKMENTINT